MMMIMMIMMMMMMMMIVLFFLLFLWSTRRELPVGRNIQSRIKGRKLVCCKGESGNLDGKLSRIKSTCSCPVRIPGDLLPSKKGPKDPNMYPAPAWRHGDKYAARWNPRRTRESIHGTKQKNPSPCTVQYRDTPVGEEQNPRQFRVWNRVDVQHHQNKLS